jgi:hypothetical protein
MSLSLKDLQEVMAPLTDIGKGEETFEIGSLKVTLRTLTPEEEIATQRYARGALTEGDQNDSTSALDYLDKLRLSTLGYSIIQIGGMDFRNVDTIETGEKLDNGVAVRIKKNEAIIKVMEGWSRPMITAVFQRFTTLLDKVETRIEKTIQYDDDHIDAEIIRLEEKLAEFKAAKAQRDLAKNDIRGEMLNAAAGKPSKPEKEKTWEEVDTKVSEEPPLSVAVPTDIPRALEESPTKVSEVAPAAAPATAPVAEPQGPKEPRKPVFGPRPAPKEPKSEPGDPLKDVQSSFIDTTDENEIEAENRRLLLERTRRAGVKPPHQSAREVAESLEKPVAAGTMSGVPVFKMPTEELSPGSARVPVPAPHPGARSNINPKFRPPQK